MDLTFGPILGEIGSYFGCAQFLVNALNAVTLASLLTPLAILLSANRQSSPRRYSGYFLRTRDILYRIQTKNVVVLNNGLNVENILKAI